ncbi:MAG: hypothetical protein AB9M53_03605 [Leptothrix sp. (in: b-proteobacteria)]
MMSDTNDPGASNRVDLRQMLTASAPPGPCDADLVSIAELARWFIAAAAPARDMTESQAGREVCAALWGTGTWKGKAPARLTVWHRTTSNTYELSREPTYIEGDRYQSPFEKAFGAYGLCLLGGWTLADLPQSLCEFQPTPRFLVVNRSDALKAFNLEPMEKPAQLAPTDLSHNIIQDETKIPYLKRTKNPGERWNNEHYILLLEQFNYYRQNHKTSKSAELTLAETWGLTGNSIHTYLTKAKKIKKPETEPFKVVHKIM